MEARTEVKRRNYLIRSLDREAADRLGPHLKTISNELGEDLLKPGDPIDFLYFPETSMASAMGLTPEGGTAEIGLTGFEGVVGASRLLGVPTQPNLINIQMAGTGAMLPAEFAEEEFARGGVFQRAVLLYLNELIVQISQTAVCNALHGMEQRLARWMLMCHDRSDGDTLDLTQEFLSLMVGVTRQSISGCAQQLQERGVISYSRGRIQVLDRPALESASCSCYRIVALRRVD
jgi:CRP-like cAMP-binding protein